MINKSTVTKIWKRYKEEKTIEPKPHNKGRKAAFCDKKMEQIKAKIKEQPDITLEELVEKFNLNISISALSRKLTKLDLTFKKRHFFQRSNSVQISRGEWVEYIKYIDVNRLVYLDEMSVNIGMTRLYGRSPKGERIFEYTPDIRYKRLSVLSTVRVNGEMNPFVYKGTLNGNLFKQYIWECVVPNLKPFDILIMDRLSSENVKKSYSELAKKILCSASFL